MAPLISALPMIMMAGGTALNVAGSLQEGKIARANAEADAATLEAQAQSRKAQAFEEARVKGEEARRVAEEGKARESAALAAYGAAGVAPNAVVLAKIVEDTSDQIFELRRAGASAYRSGMWEADWLRQTAGYRRKIGKYAEKGSRLTALSKGLTGGFMLSQMGGGKTTLTG